MYKNLKTPAAECLENGNYHVYRYLFPAKQHAVLSPKSAFHVTTWYLYSSDAEKGTL